MLIIVGSTASGKDSIRRELVKLGMDSVIAYTTRPQRDNETNGIDYNFITEKKFNSLCDEGYFAETTSFEVDGCETWYYATSLNDLTNNKVIICNPESVKQIVKYTNLKPVVCRIFCDEDEQWNRLRQRGDKPSEARRRIEADNKDFEDRDTYIDFSLRNDGKISQRTLARRIYNTYKQYEYSY